MKKLLIIITTILLSSVHSQTLAQDVRFIADMQAIGKGLVNQTITYDAFTYNRSVTGMSGLNVGINIGLPLDFETNITAGSLFNFASGWGSSGNTTYSSSTSFVVPRLGVEIARSFIWNEDKFLSGLNLGIGIDRYLQSTFKSSQNSSGIKILYNGATGMLYRLKMVLREGKRFQLEPNIAFRMFNLVANDYKLDNSTGSLHPSMQKIKGRNIEVGLIVLIGGSK